jgi:hypothetical protein
VPSLSSRASKFSGVIRIGTAALLLRRSTVLLDEPCAISVAMRVDQSQPSNVRTSSLSGETTPNIDVEQQETQPTTDPAKATDQAALPDSEPQEETGLERASLRLSDTSTRSHLMLKLSDISQKGPLPPTYVVNTEVRRLSPINPTACRRSILWSTHDY